MAGLAGLFPEGSEARVAAEALDRRTSAPPILAGSTYDAELSERLTAIDGVRLLYPATPADITMAETVRSGLLLLNDDFEQSHTVSQGIGTATGSYWHGLAHRREGTRGAGLESNMNNARYWFRRVGSFPTYDSLYRDALRLLEAANAPGRKAADLERRGAWDAVLFIDWCEAAERGEDPDGRPVLEAIQAAEMRLLIEHCLNGALGR